MNEIWKPVLGYEGLYEVSNLGRVRSIGYGKTKIRKSDLNCHGYLRVKLCKNNKKKSYLVHRLVWESFIGTIPEGMQVNHIDEDKTNNFIYVNPDGSVDLEKSNLNLMTCKENCNWGTRNKRQSEKMVNGKLSKSVYQYTLDGKFVKEWPSTMECGRNGFEQSNVSACCCGKLKTHKGFIWSYTPLT